MAFANEKRAALELLESIENGSVSATAASALVNDADPALVYLIVAWLRSRYSGGHPAAEGVLGRLVELTGRSSVKAIMREGGADSIVAWFEEVHSYRDFDGPSFIDVVVDKLEG